MVIISCVPTESRDYNVPMSRANDFVESSVTVRRQVSSRSFVKVLSPGNKSCEAPDTLKFKLRGQYESTSTDDKGNEDDHCTSVCNSSKSQLFKPCSLDLPSRVAIYSNNNGPSSVRSLRSFRSLPGRRSSGCFDRRRSVGGLYLDAMQIRPELLSEMTLNTPGRVSPRNKPASTPFACSESTESVLLDHGEWSTSGTSLGSEDREEEEGDYPPLTDCKVEYQDLWGCRTPQLSTYRPCEPIAEDREVDGF